MATELHRTFINALESLPDPYRQLLTMHELNGLDTEGISRLIGMTSAQVRIGLLHARQAMRGRLFDRMRVVVV